ncbi:MAG: Penicillin acylase 2 precursor [Candidatus Heimdallarchaeota archaeon LC_2]|nr:MAG: Penicillin acylase 2 precursor [Candidatus Heimdallarchaeota archaeon LC_2]
MSIFTDILAPFLKFGITAFGKKRLPLIDGSLIVPGLQKPVEINRDEYGIPHIQASNDHDLYFSNGFIHAQDRLWQMELNRRVAKGTLSELFGEVALDTDRISRTLGFHRIGKQDWENLGKEDQELINSYIKGVNAHINSLDTKLPIEFSLVKHKPELWTPEDSMAFMRLMVFQLSHAWYGEIIRAKLIEAVGEENASKLEIHYPEDNPSILPDTDIEFNKIDKAGKLKKTQGPFLKQSMGSNSWVISADRSATGSPILCNDMHLQLSTPSVWYKIHLKSNNVNSTGVSLPGVPMILVGHNEKISWGATLAFTDSEDLFIETFDKENPFTKYKYRDKWKESEIILEQIDIKDKDPHIEKVIYTDHGVIISDILSEKNERLALSSMSLRPSKTLKGFTQLNYANNWDDFVEAMRNITAPQLNFVYADSKNIGYWCSGKVPIRKKGNGMVPVDGSSGQYDWKGEVPFEEMPHAFNPKSGLIVTTNNKVIPDDFPHYLGSVWMNGYRAKRIEDYFNSLEKISIEDCKKMQLDFMCLPGIEFVNIYKELDVFGLDPNPKVKAAYNKMIEWDGNLTADSIGGCLYEVTRYFVTRAMLIPNLGEELTNTFMGVGLHPIVLPSHEFFGHDTVVLLRNLNDPGSWWIKHAGGKEQLLRRGFNTAFEYLLDKLGSNINKWQWGAIHKAIFEHSMSIQAPMDKVFNRGNIPVGGDTDTTCQMAIMPDDPFNVKGGSWAPSVRIINDMGDLVKSESMYAPGQSGQIGSKHYDDLINMWDKGEYMTMNWTRGQIESKLEGKLILNP